MVDAVKKGLSDVSDAAEAERIRERTRLVSGRADLAPGAGIPGALGSAKDMKTIAAGSPRRASAEPRWRARRSRNRRATKPSPAASPSWPRASGLIPRVAALSEDQRRQVQEIAVMPS